MSSYVIAVPEALAAASADLSGIGESLRSASATAAPSTTEIVAAGRDEGSAAIARVFGSCGAGFPSRSAQSAQFHNRFVEAFRSGEAAYARTEAASASPLQALRNDVMGAINTP